jgi:hypothetical protein
MMSRFLRLTVIVVGMSIMCLAPALAASWQTPQADRQPDPDIVAGNVQAIRSALREIDLGLQQAVTRDALKPGSRNANGFDAGAVKRELENISKTLKTLEQRLSRVLTLEALKPTPAGARTPGRRDFRPVTTEMEAIAEEFEKSCARVNKIEALTIKQTSRAAQTLISDLDFIQKSASKTQDAMKRVLFGAAGVTGGLN